MAVRVTIADVARAAGVSYQTVSRAINGKGEISPETRQRVLAVIEQLGYRPSSIARGLVTDRTLTIGLVVPDIANPFFPAIVKGAEEAARAAGYSLLLCNTAEDPQRETEVLHTLEEKRVDGLVLCSPRLPAEQLRPLLERHRAAVLVNRRLPEVRVGSVRVDDALGTRLAIEHLAKASRRHIGFLAGPPASHSGHERAAGFAAGLAEAGLSVDTSHTLPCAPDFSGGHQASAVLLASHPETDALLCFNDLVAVGALLACAEAGRKVPDDVAVIGADDIPLAALVTPPLTTVHISQEEIGSQAAAMLLAMVHNEDTIPADIVLRPELIVRQSG